MDDPLRNHLDEQGRLTGWPSRRNKLGLQRLALERLAAAFDPGRPYTEKEVNEVLKGLHTFGDWALLRRELVEGGFLCRTRNGSEYRRIMA